MLLKHEGHGFQKSVQRDMLNVTCNMYHQVASFKKNVIQRQNPFRRRNNGSDHIQSKIFKTKRLVMVDPIDGFNIFPVPVEQLKNSLIKFENKFKKLQPMPKIRRKRRVTQSISFIVWSPIFILPSSKSHIELQGTSKESFHIVYIDYTKVGL